MARPRRNWKKTWLIPGRLLERWRSEMKRTAIPLLRDLRLLDDDVLDRNVGVSPAAAGLDPLDFVDDVLALHDLAEHAVAPSLGTGRRVIQEVVVLDVDEELARGRMRVGGPRHGDGVAVVLQAVAGLVLDGYPGRLLAHPRLEAAALDHEAVDYAVEHGIGVEPRFDVSEEILDRLRRALRLKLECDDAEVGLKLDHGAPLLGWFQCDRFDHDGPLGNVLVLLERRGRRLGNPQHRVHPLHHAPEHRVTESLRVRFSVVEKAVVLDVDEELRGRRIRVRCARHRNRSQFVLQPRLECDPGLVFDWSTGLFFAHSRLEPADLNHDTVDDTMKDRAI